MVSLSVVRESRCHVMLGGKLGTTEQRLVIQCCMTPRQRAKWAGRRATASCCPLRSNCIGAQCTLTSWCSWSGYRRQALDSIGGVQTKFGKVHGKDVHMLESARCNLFTCQSHEHARGRLVATANPSRPLTREQTTPRANKQEKEILSAISEPESVQSVRL